MLYFRLVVHDLVRTFTLERRGVDTEKLSMGRFRFAVPSVKILTPPTFQRKEPTNLDKICRLFPCFFGLISLFILLSYFCLYFGPYSILFCFYFDAIHLGILLKLMPFCFVYFLPLLFCPIFFGFSLI